MRHLKTFVLTAVVSVAFGAILVGTASATIIENGSGTLGSGTSITANSEGTTELHPPIGSINCAFSHVSGKTTNSGGAGVNVNGNIEALSFTGCNATVTVLQKGTLSIAGTSGSNGTLYSTGAEVTVQYLGFHCIFKTNNTKLGTLTGGSPATLDIEATIPRTGGSSGAFCGSTAAWTGSYSFSTPSTLRVTGAGGGGEEGLASMNLTPNAEKWTSWYSRMFEIDNNGWSSFTISAWYIGVQYGISDPNGCMGKTLGIWDSCTIYVTGKPTYSPSTLKVEGTNGGKVVASDTSYLN